MLSATLALLTGSALWLLGMRPYAVREHLRAAEFWWSSAAFFTASIGTLASFQAFQFGTPETITLFRALPIAAVGVFMAVRTLWHNPVVPGTALGLLPVFGLLLAFSADGTQVLMPALSLLTFLPALLVPRDGYDLRALQAGVRAGVASALLVLCMLVVTMPDALIGLCRGDKCSIWGLAFGAVGTGNAMGMSLAAAGATAMLTARSLPQLAAIAAGSWLLTDLTASRSAMIGWVIGAFVALIFHVSKLTANRIYVGLGVTGVALATATFPLLKWSASDFTGRAGLWQYALSLWSESPIFGRGASFWVGGNNGSDGVDRNYSTHSLLTEMLLSVGVFGIIALITALILAANGRGRFSTSIYATALIGITIGMSLLEVYSAPGRVYLCASAMAYLFIASQSRVHQSRGLGLSESAVLATQRRTDPTSTSARNVPL